MNKFAREAYNLGVRYIGGCCGFQAYHIRAVAEELAEERGVLPRGSEKHIPWAGGLRMHTKPWVRARASRYTHRPQRLKNSIISDRWTRSLRLHF